MRIRGPTAPRTCCWIPLPLVDLAPQLGRRLGPPPGAEQPLVERADQEAAAEEKCETDPVPALADAERVDRREPVVVDEGRRDGGAEAGAEAAESGAQHDRRVERQQEEVDRLPSHHAAAKIAKEFPESRIFISLDLR